MNRNKQFKKLKYLLSIQRILNELNLVDRNNVELDTPYQRGWEGQVKIIQTENSNIWNKYIGKIGFITTKHGDNYSVKLPGGSINLHLHYSNLIEINKKMEVRVIKKYPKYNVGDIINIEEKYFDEEFHSKQLITELEVGVTYKLKETDLFCSTTNSTGLHYSLIYLKGIFVGKIKLPIGNRFIFFNEEASAYIMFGVTNLDFIVKKINE